MHSPSKSVEKKGFARSVRAGDGYDRDFFLNARDQFEGRGIKVDAAVDKNT